MRDKKKWIVVFLKNKLISLDSILPLALEINQCCNYKFYFIVWQYESYKSIIEDNVVMRDMALSIGQIVCPSQQNKGTISNKINKIITLANVLVKLYLNKSYIFHFGALDQYPLMILTKIINKKKIVQCESSLTGRYVKNIQESVASRNNIIEIPMLQQRSTQENFDNYKRFSYPINNSGILIGFDLAWNWFKHPDAISCKKLVFSEKRKAKKYFNFMLERSNYYLNQEGLTGLEKNKTIVIVLGHYGDGQGEYRNKLLYEALTVLKNLDLNIIIKPHIFCDMNLVESIVKNSKCVNSKIYYTKIHPQILQEVSFGGLFVNNSTIRCDYKDMGFPVIQYNGGMTDKVITDKCSVIICSDQNQLADSLKLLMKNPENNILKEGKEFIDGCKKVGKIFNC